MRPNATLTPCVMLLCLDLLWLAVPWKPQQVGKLWNTDQLLIASGLGDSKQPGQPA